MTTFDWVLVLGVLVLGINVAIVLYGVFFVKGKGSSFVDRPPVDPGALHRDGRSPLPPHPATAPAVADPARRALN